MTDPRLDPAYQKQLARKNARVMLICSTVVAGMISLSFAAVPLYELFCQVTGFGGTTQVAEGELDASEATGRTITVRFNADTDPRLPWHFDAEQTSIDVEIGRSNLTYYRIDNKTARTTAGVAAYNVTPLKAGKYFHKVQCFCFDEQVLKAGDGMDMPVLFYVDPEILEDRKMADVDTITLSYTFFPADTGDLNEQIGDYYDNQGVAVPTKASTGASTAAAPAANQPDKGLIDG